MIKAENLKDDIIIHSKPREISLIAGNKKSNKKYFYDKYKIKMTFVNDEDLYLVNKGKKIELDIKAFIKKYVEKNYGGDLN